MLLGSVVFWIYQIRELDVCGLGQPAFISFHSPVLSPYMNCLQQIAEYFRICFSTSQLLHLKTSLASAVALTWHFAHLAWIPCVSACHKSSGMKWFSGQSICPLSEEQPDPLQMYFTFLLKLGRPLLARSPVQTVQLMVTLSSIFLLSLIHIWRCRRIERCRSRWSPYH